MKERPSRLFLLGLWLLRPFRRPYLWAKKQWPTYFAKRLAGEVDLDTSRMLTEFNWFHRMFFGRGFDTIKFDVAELKNIQTAQKKGPVVLLMRNWGQVEYNYFNDLFLNENLPLVTHNNMVRMGHWMRSSLRRPLVRKKLDLYFETGRWPYNNELFNLETALQSGQTVLHCLNLARGIHWMDETPDSQTTIFKELLRVQESLEKPIQLVPLHFIYDKHPGKAKKSLFDIMLGEKENPGYFRKMLLFLRNYQKRAVARISEPIDLRVLVSSSSTVAPEAVSYDCAHFMQKTFDVEARQVTGPKLKSRRSFLAKVLNTPKVRQKIRQATDQNKMGFEVGEKKVSSYLKEIASDIRFSWIETWDVFLSWLFNTLYDGLEVDEEGLKKIKKVAKDSPLVLMPSHKSHVDYLLLSHVFYQNDMSLPHVCAGLNLSFWPLGAIFRRSGAYFIRRTLPSDPFYPLALKSYVQALMSEGYFQEFFIEGTRSRSGKLFPPKTGLLHMMIESFLENDSPDLYFVPISIGYERIIEEGAYLKELKGDKKKKENFFDLFRLPKFLKRRYGKVYLEFSEPISLKTRMGTAKGDLQKDPAALKDFVQDLAQSTCLAINQVTVLLPSPLVAAALLTQQKKSMTREEIHNRVQILLDLAARQGARLSESLKKDPHFAAEEILETFAKEGLVRLHRDEEEDFFTIPEESRSHLDFFKNKGIHVFAGLAIYQLCQQPAEGPHPIPLAQGEAAPLSTEENFCLARDLLSKDFFLSEETPNQVSAPDWLGEMVLPVVETYRLCLQAITRLEIEKMEEKTLVRKILELGETYKLKGTLQYPESLSRFTVQNAIGKFTELGILRNHVAEMGAAGRHSFSKGSEEKRKKNEELLSNLLNK